MTEGRDFGLERGKVFPADRARSLINPLRRLVQSPARTVGAIALAPTARVLEVGSGPGFYTPALTAAVPSGEVVVLDLQPEMLVFVRDRVGTHARLVAADALTLPFPSGVFDAVFLATMLGEVPDPVACVREVRRVLDAGGVVAIAETRRDSDYIRVDELRRLFEPNGFVFDGRRGPKWQYVARFRVPS